MDIGHNSKVEIFQVTVDEFLWRLDLDEIKIIRKRDEVKHIGPRQRTGCTNCHIPFGMDDLGGTNSQQYFFMIGVEGFGENLLTPQKNSLR
jgi:hypothetical protein